MKWAWRCVLVGFLFLVVMAVISIASGDWVLGILWWLMSMVLGWLVWSWRDHSRGTWVRRIYE